MDSYLPRHGDGPHNQVENGVVDPTLATLGAEDVMLNMDDILVYQDDDWSDSSSEGPEGTVDGE
jgi:hypothetical protein